MATSYDDDFTYNPFADDAHSPSSALPDPSHHRLRRRRSSLTDNSSPPPTTSRKRHLHLRSRTEIDVPSSPGVHPLRTALAATIGSLVENTRVTRPYLSRLVDNTQTTDEPETQNVKDPPPEEEKDVIVHQVASTDSLAGISLKYGISLANLRRANQLWTSDSIHRRDVLYIPVEQASRAQEYLPDPKPTSLTPDIVDAFSEASLEDSSSLASAISTSNSEPLPSSSASATITFLRVPARQLSYFPPSTKPLASLPDAQPAPRPARAPKLSPSSSKYGASQANSSLTSILTAFPIAASTRSEILTRLSLDSTSSSFTDRSRGNSDEESGHELDDVVQKRRQVERPRHDSEAEDLSLPTPKASHPRLRYPHVTSNVAIQQSSKPHRPFHPQSLTSTSPPTFYVTQAHETYVRTSQMEPSAPMQVPPRSPSIARSHTLGRLAGKNLASPAVQRRVGNRTDRRASLDSIHDAFARGQ